MVNKRREIDFSESNIRSLFGPEAAEDEEVSRLKEYYFKGDLYEQIQNTLPLKILVGHKGIGKSATFKVAYNENIEKDIIAIWIRPDDIMELCQDEKNLLQMIRDWKKGLSNIIFEKVLEHLKFTDNDSINSISQNAGKIITTLTAVFKKKIEASISLEPAVNKSITKYLSKSQVFVYIDDLDRGWSGELSSVHRISALLNAVRDMTNDNPGLCVRISLRSDVYFLVRTSDESTDKIESCVVWYTWTQHQILIMLAKRISAYFGERVNEKTLLKLPQFVVAQSFDDVFDSTFYGQGKWADVPTYKVLASLIRRRPRDLVKLCILSARSAKENGHQLITTDDLMDNFDYYSQERLQDTVNEYRSELPDIERLLMGMKPSNRERKTSEEFIYTTETLMQKITIIQSKGKFTFAKGTIASTEELAAFLYKINFLVARKKEERSEYIDRKYFEDNKYLSNRFVDFGYKWEVHPAFRWALYPDGGSFLYNSLNIDNEL